MSIGLQIAQCCHSVADFSYFLPTEFKEWRQNSNYKICLSTKNQKSLIKLYNKLLNNNAKVIAFYEPDLNNEMTAITLLGKEYFKKYTTYLPLAGKEYGGDINKGISDSSSLSTTTNGNIVQLVEQQSLKL